MTMMLQTKMTGTGECSYLDQIIQHCINRDLRNYEMCILHNVWILYSHWAAFLQLGTCGSALSREPDRLSYKA